MQLRNLIGIAAIAVFALAGGTAVAQSVGDFRSKATGDWDAKSTWEYWNGSAWVNADSPPGADNFVTIQSAHEVTVDTSEAVDHLDVQGTLVIATNGTLTVDGSDSDESVIASGKYIELSTDTSVLAVVDNDHTFSGSGAVVGLDPEAEIRISGDIMMISQVTIQGELKVADGGGGTSNPVFRNEFVVVADAEDGTLTLGSGVMLDDVSGALWAAIGDGATLLFEQAALAADPCSDLTGALQGAFGINECGAMDFQASVETEGNLYFIEGSLFTANGECLTYNLCAAGEDAICAPSTQVGCSP